MTKTLSLFFLCLSNFFINASQSSITLLEQNTQGYTFIFSAPDQEDILITYGQKSNLIHATFDKKTKFNGLYDDCNTYVTKDLATNTFSVRHTSLFIPDNGRPFYVPKHQNTLLEKKLKLVINSFQQQFGKIISPNITYNQDIKVRYNPHLCIIQASYSTNDGTIIHISKPIKSRDFTLWTTKNRLASTNTESLDSTIIELLKQKIHQYEQKL